MENSSNDDDKTGNIDDKTQNDNINHSVDIENNIANNSLIYNIKKYTREHMLPLLIILVSLFIVFLCIIIFYSLYKTTKDKVLLQTHTEESNLTFPFSFRESVANNISRQFKIILFDAGFNITNYKEKREYSSNLFEQIIELKLDSTKQNDVTKNVIDVLKNNGFIMYNDDFTSAVNGRLSDDYSITVVFDIKDFDEQYIGGFSDFSIGNPFAVKSPAIGSGRIALLIDDAGANLMLAKRLSSLNIPLTVAVLPHLKYSQESANLFRDAGIKVFLHYPMQPEGYPDIDPGEGAVLLSTPSSSIYNITNDNVLSIGQIDGFNNHMGSAVTKNTGIMRIIFDSMKPYTNVYIDSRTTPSSVAYSECKKQGNFKCGLNQKFLDNYSEHEYIAKQLYESADIARTEGVVIAIGHLKPDTIYVLEQTIPFLSSLGYEFVFVNDIIN